MRANKVSPMRLLLVLSLTATISACRAPVSPPSPPDQASELQKVEPLAPTTETAKPPLPDLPPVAPTKETIARYLPESRLTVPEKDLAPRRIEYNSVLNTRPGKPPRDSAWRYRLTRQGALIGFEFSNDGGNRILPPRRDAIKNQFFTRDFQFRFDERARQDIYLMVSDWAPSRDRVFRLSELMNRLMLFFPRAFLPAIVNWQNRDIVTLPTGEEVAFNALTHEVVAGVFSEGPVDLNPDRAARQFPAIGYLGKGVTIRADARGVDPRINTVALITAGAPAPNCEKGTSCNRCEVPSKELWEQTGAVRFKFANDADFDRFLLSRCAFGLPRIGADFAIAPALATR
jgi:hypothetical protein